ncbi:melatonin receptor type 1B-B-like isoform X3 [Girardinichthys multiradiatus]|nr:melatonin receptor type 1B-B-like isoform X3 [Girardinichthys multiradiatus]
MPDTLTLLKNRTEPRLGQLERSLPAEGTARPAWVIAILASVLIFTTVVDVLGNLLVIISVFRNRKLRNAEKKSTYPTTFLWIGVDRSGTWRKHALASKKQT